MSIEKALADLTAALTANTAALSAVAGAAKAATAGKTPDKPATAGKPAGAGKPKAKTDDEMRTAFGGYLTTGAAEGKPARKANITSILEHYEVKLVTELPADKREAALVDLAAYQAGNEPEWASSTDTSGEEDEDDMLG